MFHRSSLSIKIVFMLADKKQHSKMSPKPFGGTNLVTFTLPFYVLTYFIRKKLNMHT